jgi:hypothetical protein
MVKIGNALKGELEKVALSNSKIVQILRSSGKVNGPLHTMIGSANRDTLKRVINNVQFSKRNLKDIEQTFKHFSEIRKKLTSGLR